MEHRQAQKRSGRTGTGPVGREGEASFCGGLDYTQGDRTQFVVEIPDDGMSAERLRAGATFDRAMRAGSEDCKIRDPHHEFMRRNLPARLVVSLAVLPRSGRLRGASVATAHGNRDRLVKGSQPGHSDGFGCALASSEQAAGLPRERIQTHIAGARRRCLSQCLSRLARHSAGWRRTCR